MQTLDLNKLTGNLGSVKNGKSLTQIIDELEASRGSLNPFTIIARNILADLNQHFIFPFSQPAVVNPLEFNEGQPLYISMQGSNGHFQRASLRRNFGMDRPIGLYLCIDGQKGPFFVYETDLVTVPYAREYRVFDSTSFQSFIAQLRMDMSFLKPMLRHEVLGQKDSNQIYGEGELVFIPGQKYGKIAIVSEFKTKQYYARLVTPEGFHAQNVGVDLEDLVVLGDRRFDEDFERFLGERRIEWTQRIGTDVIGRPLGLGANLVLIGPSNFDGSGYGPVGYVTIYGFDVDCAVVTPVRFNRNEAHPWGNPRQLTVPVQEITPLGNSTEGHNLVERYFADTIHIEQVLRAAAGKYIDDPNVRGVAAYHDMHRYSVLLRQLSECPEVRPDLVGAQFVNLLTKTGTDGIERLAEISKKEPGDLARELLARDLRVARDELEDGKKVYGQFVPRLNEIVQRHTHFDSVESMLRENAQKAGVYQMNRDGTHTLACIVGLEFGYLSKNMPKHLTFRKKPFLKLSQVPQESVWKGGNERRLIGVYYRIMRKGQKIRYGHDQNGDFTSPGLTPVDGDFILQPIASRDELVFLKHVIGRIKRKVGFDGDARFYEDFKALLRETGKNAAPRHSFGYEDDSVRFMKEVIPLYNGIRQLTNNLAVKDRLVLALIGDEPLLLEAVYDHEALQKTTIVRDHYWRDDPHDGKNQFLSQFGWPRRCSSYFADEFYHQLALIDQYHRGLPRQEMESGLISLTRERTLHSRSGENDSTLGLNASPLADNVLSVISSQLARLSAGVRTFVGYLPEKSSE